MARAHIYMPITTSSGDIIAPIVIRLLEPNSTTSIPETVYTAASGTSEHDNSTGFTNNDGVVDVYLAKPRRVRLGITPPGQNEMFLEDIDIGTDAILYAPAALQVTNLPAAVGQVLTSTAAATASWQTPAGGGGGGGSGLPIELTRADAITLRDSNGLTGPVFITDGPTIGIAPNTVDTQLLLIPVNEYTFSTEVQVSALSFSDSAWWARGSYDIDGNVFRMLADTADNVVIDFSGDVIANQFPWGNAASSGAVRGNQIQFTDTGLGSTLELVGWGDAVVAGALIRNNVIRNDAGRAWAETVVDLTYFGSGCTFANNTVTGAKFLVWADVGIDADVSGNTFFAGAVVKFQTTVPPSESSNHLQMRNNTVEGGDFQVRGNLESFSVYNSHLTGASIDFESIVTEGEQCITLATAELVDVSVSTDPSCAAKFGVSESRVVRGTYIFAGDGDFFASDGSSLVEGYYETVSGSTGSIAIDSSEITGLGLTMHASCTRTLYVNGSKIISGSIDLEAGGGFQIDNSYVANSTFNSAASSTRALVITNCVIAGNTAITNSRTAASSGYQDDITNCTFVGATITSTGSAGTTTDNVPLLQRCDVRSGGTVTITSPVGGTGAEVIADTEVASKATLNCTAGGNIVNSRFAAGATFNTGAFPHSGVIVEGAFTKTASAANTNTLKNKSFDDIV